MSITEGGEIYPRRGINWAITSGEKNIHAFSTGVMVIQINTFETVMSEFQAVNGW